MCSGISAILHGRIGTGPGSITDARSMTGRDASYAGHPPRIIGPLTAGAIKYETERTRKVRTGAGTRRLPVREVYSALTKRR